MIQIPTDIQYIHNALKPYSAWVVGGAVRDFLQTGLWSDDIDMTTSATPEIAMELLEKAGLHVIPTGLKHGTITAVYKGKPYEITTLRKDVETNGRHAEVAFTGDVLEDAKRRDFTINAIYLDENGGIFDPFGGKKELLEGKIRFIGAAKERIEEDYLRVLRFFRFSARFSKQKYDEDVLKIIEQNVNGVAQLSKERVLDEFLKFMKVEDVLPSLKLMQTHGVLGALNFPNVQSDLLKNEDAFCRFIGLFRSDFSALKKSLKFSNAQKKIINLLEKSMKEIEEKYWETPKALCYFYGKDITRMALTLNNEDTSWINEFDVPVFPIKAQDIMAEGVEAGPKLGKLMKELELWWVNHNFVKKEECLITLRKKLKDD